MIDLDTIVIMIGMAVPTGRRIFKNNYNIIIGLSDRATYSVESPKS